MRELDLRMMLREEGFQQIEIVMKNGKWFTQLRRKMQNKMFNKHSLITGTCNYQDPREFVNDKEKSTDY